jgi:hypothetical protein
VGNPHAVPPGKAKEEKEKEEKEKGRKHEK